MRLRCGSLTRSFGFQPPDALERRVVQFQSSVRAEHGDAFLQGVERRFLNLDQRVVGTFETQLVAHVLVEEEQTAQGMGLSDDAQRLSARQVPQLLGAWIEALEHARAAPASRRGNPAARAAS